MAKVTFRCKRSGNYVSFINEDDIRSMLNHEGYEEVKHETEEAKQEIPVQVANAKEVLKKRGRPSRKVVMEI